MRSKEESDIGMILGMSHSDDLKDDKKGFKNRFSKKTKPYHHFEMFLYEQDELSFEED